MIKAILLDFNGVIIDDERIQMEAYQEVLAHEDIALTEADYYSSLGMDDRTFVTEAYKRAGKTAETNKVLEITQKKAEKWRETVAGNVPLFPGIENFIRKMAEEFTLGIVSMATRDDVMHVLDVTGFTDHFSILVSAEDVSACKPDPECYRTGFRLIDGARTAAGRLPMLHSECLVIEDSPPGIAAAVSADLPALGVTNTVSEDDLRAAGATWVAEYLDDWMPDSIRRAFA